MGTEIGKKEKNISRKAFHGSWALMGTTDHRAIEKKCREARLVMGAYYQCLYCLGGRGEITLLFGAGMGRKGNGDDKGEGGFVSLNQNIRRVKKWRGKKERERAENNALFMGQKRTR